MAGAAASGLVPDLAPELVDATIPRLLVVDGRQHKLVVACAIDCARALVLRTRPPRPANRSWRWRISGYSS